MNHSNTLHPFAVRAVVLSILITSTMALLPTLAGAGTHHAAQTLQAAATQSQNAKVTG